MFKGTHYLSLFNKFNEVIFKMCKKVKYIISSLYHWNFVSANTYVSKSLVILATSKGEKTGDIFLIFKIYRC